MDEIMMTKTAATAEAMPESNEKAWTFRRLRSVDVFPMLKILSKIGVNSFTGCFEKDSVKGMLANMTAGERNAAASAVGFSVFLEIANVIFCNLPKCENEIFKLLADTSNLEEKQIRDMDFVDFTEMIMDFIRKEEFPDFIKVVSKYIK